MFPLCALYVQVSLAKPPSDKKKKEEILRARERRMMQMMQGRSGVVGYVICFLFLWFKFFYKFKLHEQFENINLLNASFSEHCHQLIQV